MQFIMREFHGDNILIKYGPAKTLNWDEILAMAQVFFNDLNDGFTVSYFFTLISPRMQIKCTRNTLLYKVPELKEERGGLEISGTLTGLNIPIKLMIANIAPIILIEIDKKYFDESNIEMVRTTNKLQESITKYIENLELETYKYLAEKRGLQIAKNHYEDIANYNKKEVYDAMCRKYGI